MCQLDETGLVTESYPMATLVVSCVKTVCIAGEVVHVPSPNFSTSHARFVSVPAQPLRFVPCALRVSGLGGKCKRRAQVEKGTLLATPGSARNLYFVKNRTPLKRPQYNFLTKLTGKRKATRMQQLCSQTLGNKESCDVLLQRANMERTYCGNRLNKQYFYHITV